MSGGSDIQNRRATSRQLYTIFQTNREVKPVKNVRITVKRIARYDDLIAQYENPIEHACDMKVGQVFLCQGWQKPEGFCDSAWETVSPFVLALAHGSGFL